MEVCTLIFKYKSMADVRKKEIENQLISAPPTFYQRMPYGYHSVLSSCLRGNFIKVC